MNSHEALARAIEIIELECIDEDSEDILEELNTLKEMFEPRKGDEPEVAKARSMRHCTCVNCGLEWPGMAMPAPISDIALTAQRLAKCPRCYATEDIMISN